jgi:P4 family phage/plasmid primase-like protien
MPFNYLPERAGEAHKWLAYLENCWGDDPDYEDKVAALQEAFAATMFGIGPEYQRAILLYGTAGTGKTQALEVLRAMMPPRAVSSVPPQKWGERFQMGSMIGKTLNVCGELPEETVIDGDKFKEVVEGTTQNIEFKGQDAFDFVPIASHWFASNHLPRSRDTSRGFVRRWLVLEFGRVVPLEERQVNFHKILISQEREAIAAWAVQGLSRLMAQKDYTQPESHLKRLNQIRRANNSVVAWIQSNDKVVLTGNNDDVASAREVFDHYVFHMREVSRGFSVTFERFLQMMEEMDGIRLGEFECKITGLMKPSFTGIKLNGHVFGV